MIAVVNFCIVLLVAHGGTAPIELFKTIWPMILISTIATVMVMSLLYSALQDILIDTERREKVALKLGMQDSLTGLANRRLLEDRLNQAIDQARRYGAGFAVHLLDLDHFKRVNDVHGHPVGDALLTEVAKRLKAISRASDTTARLGGDEFVIVQAGVSNLEDSEQFCDRLIDIMRDPFHVEGRDMTAGFSIGSVLSGHGHSADDFLRKADIALYTAKASGRNCSSTFCDAMEEKVQRSAQIESALRKALPSGRGLSVYFQPQVNVQGALAGVEALLRWNHESLGQLNPAEVVSIAEDVGLIEALGDHVFRQACQAARCLPGLFVSVNLSPLQFASATGLAEHLAMLAKAAGVSCSRIELEITEHLFVEHGFKIEEQIEALQAHGFRIALDDFGTGYSSLSYLRRFPVDKIKLDKAFATDEYRKGNVALIRGVVSLAHSLGLEVVAEGIETAEQEQVALEAGCDGLQGYRYGKAQSLGDFLHQNQSVRSVG